MFVRKSLYLIVLLSVCVFSSQAGDIASFVDLGFSPNGAMYMFAQYGIQSSSLRPWAELYVVDVARNDFVSGGQISYVHDSPAISGQDGSGALYHLLNRQTALVERHGVNFLLQGKPLYISLDDHDGVSGEPIEFRDFEQGSSYKAALVSAVEGSGAGLKSSFHINLEQTARDGSKKTSRVGNPQIKRSLIASYRIRRVLVDPQSKGIIFVVEMKKNAAEGFDFRYMVETASL